VNQSVAGLLQAAQPVIADARQMVTTSQYLDYSQEMPLPECAPAGTMIDNL
jgi:hypothetical protein